MKRELAIAGIALVVSILLSSPSIAQTSPDKAEPTASIAAEVTPSRSLEEISLDEAILFASTPEDRKRLLMRCAGPPPRDTIELATSPIAEPASATR